MASSAFKGAVMGLILGCLFVLPLQRIPGSLEVVSLILFTMTVSSFLAMNFTGATPFTSPSGVEKEMRIAMPMQIVGLLVAVGVLIWRLFA